MFALLFAVLRLNWYNVKILKIINRHAITLKTTCEVFREKKKRKKKQQQGTQKRVQPQSSPTSLTSRTRTSLKQSSFRKSEREQNKQFIFLNHAHRRVEGFDNIRSFLSHSFLVLQFSHYIVYFYILFYPKNSVKKNSTENQIGARKRETISITFLLLALFDFRRLLSSKHYVQVRKHFLLPHAFIRLTP